MTQSNPMRDQIYATPKAVLEVYDEIELAARRVLTTPEIYRIREVLLIGSGDSLFAGKAIETAFRSHSGIFVQVKSPLEAGRYLAQEMTQSDRENTLVIAISNSGEAARVVEAAKILKSSGANVLALTKNSSSRLSKESSKSLVLPIPDLPSAPGFGPYIFATVSLLLIAIRLGEVRMYMTMDRAQELRGGLKELMNSLNDVIQNSDKAAKRAAEKLSQAKVFEFVAANPGVGEYGAAKILEATGRHAFARDLEEWVHLNYFDGSPEEIATVLISPSKSRSHSRVKEVSRYMEKLGRQICIIGDATTIKNAFPIAINSSIDELWSPLLTSGPLALIAAHLAELDGAEYGRGAKGRWEDCSDASTVQKSEILEFVR